MRWLWFVGSLLCFAVVFKTTSVGLALLCLLGALAFMIIGTLAVAAQRIDNSRSDIGRLIGPEEIRQMREAEARRQAAQAQAEASPAIVGLASAGAMIAAEAAARDVPDQDTGRGAEPVASEDYDDDSYPQARPGSDE